jgi:hypothetical protein
MPRVALLTVLAITGTLVVFGSSPAAARVRSFQSVKETRGVVTFRLRGLNPKQITAASLVGPGRRTVRLPLGKVRRAARQGVLRVRTPLRWRSATASSRHLARAAAKGGHKVRVVTDTTPPDTTITSGPSGTVSSTSASFAFTSSESNSTFECSLDGSAWTACSSPTAYFSLTNAAHTFQVRAKDAAGNIDGTPAARSFTVDSTTTTTPPPPPPSGGTGAPFPSRLRASGRKLVDENGYVMPTLRGFNMHVGPGFTWSQSNFDDIAALGAKVNRAVLHWDQFEPSQGVVDSTAIANLDLHIARAQAAGMYTLLELHLNVGRDPSWTSAKATEVEKYAAYGQTLTQYLAYRYGNPASPHYTKAVLGFGLNEPPLEDDNIRNGNNSIPYLEGKQRQMIGWMRAAGYAPDWIGFVAYGYASATPIYNDATENSAAVDASPTAYDSVGGNVIIDVHDYVIGCTNEVPSCDGRQWNGMIYPTYQGGPLLGTGEASSYTSSATRQAQQNAYLKPYKDFSTQANIPLMVGEWGWPQGPTGEKAWIADKKAAWANAGPTIEIQWNYDVSSSNTVWAARPGNIWRTSVTDWMVSGSG